MATHSSLPDLEQVMTVPGIGAQVMSLLPIPDRVRLRRTCRSFLSAADESLLSVTELFGEGVTAKCRPGTVGLAWLLTKCPNLDTICVASREEHREAWRDREGDRYSLRWNRVMIIDLTRPVSLGQLAAKYPGLKYLNLAGCGDVTGIDLSAIAASCRGLEALDVSGCDIDSRSVKEVARSCHALRRLAVACCKGVTNNTLVVLSQHCPQLEELDVEETRVTGRGIATLARACPRLQRLRVPACATDDIIVQVADHCRELEQLSVRHCGRVTDASIVSIAACCPRLQRLDASGCSRITDAGVTSLARGCPGLGHLDIPSAEVSDEGMRAVAEHCRQLEYLGVSYQRITDAALLEIVCNCPQLRCLKVKDCRRRILASVFHNNCPRLQNLILEEAILTPACMEAIASCHELRHLDLSFSHIMGGDDPARTGGDSLAALASGCPKLEHLDVSFTGCPGIDGGVLAIARSCPQLNVFIVEHAPVLEETVLQLIRERGPQLKYLHLVGSTLTDATMRMLAQACPRLQELRVTDCPQVTDEGIKLVERACKKLRRLALNRCGVTATGAALIDHERCMLVWIE
eukprot:jgi/Mesvir1/10636/Mv09274-RA.1